MLIERLLKRNLDEKKYRAVEFNPGFRVNKNSEFDALRACPLIERALAIKRV